MKIVLFAPERPPEVRRPTVAQPGAPAVIFSGWGPRLGG